MRHIIIDQARKHFGAGRQFVPADELLGLTFDHDVSVIEVDEILKRLEQIDSKNAQIAELRVFGGLTNEEIAMVMRISPATVKRRLTPCRAYIMSRLGERRNVRR